MLGLLYQKDTDTELKAVSGRPFPLTEIKRALKCFARRRELAGQEPTLVFIHPDHAALVEAQAVALAELGLRWEFNPTVPRRHIWLTGRLPEKENLSAHAEGGLGDEGRGKEDEDDNTGSGAVHPASAECAGAVLPG